ncbi:Ig-like domain-containing protein, partial [Rhizobium johnstonii]
MDPPRPTILFTGPAGPINASPYLLTVTLSDSSNVARVDFFKGTLQIGQALSAPYTCPAPLT